MGNKDSAPVLRDEDVAVLCQSSGLSEEVAQCSDSFSFNNFPCEVNSAISENFSPQQMIELEDLTVSEISSLATLSIINP